MDLGLHGKVVLVIGGSEGLGYATARRLALEGASVAIAARRSDVLEGAAEGIKRATGQNVLGVAADVANAEGVSRFVGTAINIDGGTSGAV